MPIYYTLITLWIPIHQYIDYIIGIHWVQKLI